MKTVEISEATASLGEYARDLGAGPVVVTRNGRPTAALVPIAGTDLETIALSIDPRFMGIIGRSRTRQAAEGGLSPDEVRRQLGLDPTATVKPENKRGTSS